MKKLLSLSLAVLLIISCILLPSCKKKPPYELVSEAIENTKTYSSYTSKFDINMEITIMGMKVDTEINMELSASGVNTDSPIYRSTMTTTALGETTTADVYVKDGIYYIKSDDISTKISADKIDGTLLEDMKIDSEDTDLSDVIVALPETAFKEDTVIVENDDGTKSVELELTAEEFKNAYTEFVKSITEAEDFTDAEFNFAPAKLKLTIDKNSISAISLSTELEMSIDGTSTKITLDISFTDINKNKSAAPIEGCEDFEEFSEKLFG